METRPCRRESAPAASIAISSPRHPRDAERAHRADQHHALDAEIQHSRSLGKNFAEGGEQQHRAAGNAGLKNDEGVQVCLPIQDYGMRSTEDVTRRAYCVVRMTYLRQALYSSP